MSEQVKDLVKEWEQLLKEVVEVPLYHPDNASVTLRRIMWFFHKYTDEKIFITNNLIEETLFYEVNLFAGLISFYTKGGLVITFSLNTPSFKAESPRPRVSIISLHAPGP